MTGDQNTLVDGVSVVAVGIGRATPGVGVYASASSVSPGEVLFERIGQSKVAARREQMTRVELPLQNEVQANCNKAVRCHRKHQQNAEK